MANNSWTARQFTTVGGGKPLMVLPSNPRRITFVFYSQFNFIVSVNGPINSTNGDFFMTGNVATILKYADFGNWLRQSMYVFDNNAGEVINTLEIFLTP